MKSCLLTILILLLSSELGTCHGFSGAIATDHDLATLVGTNLLESGANAVDAAIAVGLALGVLNPHSSGLGGGLVATVYIASEGRAYCLDAREFAWRNVLRLKDSFETLRGGSSVLVPVELLGYQALHARFGSRPFRELVKPAAHLAAQGFTIRKLLAQVLVKQQELLRKSPDLYSVFAPGNQLLQEGDLLVQSALGHTLNRISLEGADALYLGDMAKDIVEAIGNQGGVIDDTDLALARARWVDPIQFSYQGYKFYSMPLPSSGGLLLAQIFGTLKMLPQFTWGGSGSDHYMVEAMKHAFANRQYLGDGRFQPLDSKTFLDPSFHKAYADSIMPEQTREQRHYGSGALMQKSGTTHYSIADRQGNMVAVTSSINTEFGSGVYVKSLGIILNNHMDDFSFATPNAYGLVGARNNRVQPFKKPLSSMSPTVALNESLGRLVVGGSGGSRIISAVAQTVLNRLARNQSTQDSVDAARLHHQFLPDQVVVEDTIASSRQSALRRLGHKVVEGLPRNVVQMLGSDSGGTWQAAADPRKGGQAKVLP